MATTGTAKWFNAEKRYGFISRKDGRKDDRVRALLRQWRRDAARWREVAGRDDEETSELA